MGAAFQALRLPLASEDCTAGGFSTVPTAGFPQPVDPFSGPLRWRLLEPGACRSFADQNFRQLVHHWRLSSSNPRAVQGSFCFQVLGLRSHLGFLDSGNAAV
jgi:hypothetical protein